MAVNKLELSIYGDASGAIRALNRVEGRSRGVSRKMQQFGRVAAAGFVAAGAAVAGAGVVLFKAGQDIDKAYDTIRQGTGATGGALEGLKDSFRNVGAEVSSSFEDVGTAIADLNTRTGQTGSGLEDLSVQILNLTRMTDGDLQNTIATTTRVFGDWGVATGDQSETLDKFWRASQQSGASVEMLAEKVVQFGAPLRNLGFSLDESIALFGSFEQSGVNIETTMSGIRQAVGNFAEDGMDPMEGFAQVMEDVESGAFTMGDSIEVFGKEAANDMFAALNEGKFDLQDFIDTMVNGGESINDASDDTESFAEKWDNMKNRVFLALEPAAMALFDGLAEGMDALGPHLTTLSVWFNERLPGWVKTAEKWFNQKLRPIFEEVVAWVVDNWPMISDAITEVMDIIGEVVTEGVELIQAAWEQFGPFILGLIERVFPPVVEVIKGVLNAIKGIINTVTGLIKGDWEEAWTGIKQIFGGVWDAVFGILRGAVILMQETFGLLWGWVVSKAEEMLRPLVTVFESIMGAVGSVLSGAVAIFGAIWGGLSDVFKGPINWVIENVINRFLGFMRSVEDFIGLTNVVPGNLPTIGGSSGRASTSARGGNAVARSGDGIGIETDEVGNIPLGPGMGDGLGFTVPTPFSALVGFDVAEKARKAAASGIKGLLGGLGGGSGFRQLSASIMKKPIDHALDLLEEMKKQFVAPALGEGIGWQKMWAAVKSQFWWATKYSDYRPGSITSSGNLSYHARDGGRAIDVTPSADIFRWIEQNYGRQTKELIYTPMGYSLKNGQRTAPYAQAAHFDHVHWAMARGGAGTVTKPTLFLAGEAGTEDFAFMPKSKGGLRGGGGVDEAVLAKAVRKGLNGATLRFDKDGLVQLITDGQIERVRGRA